MSAIMRVSEGVWVICAKPPFIHSLDVPIKMFANSLAGLNSIFFYTHAPYMHK